MSIKHIFIKKYVLCTCIILIIFNGCSIAFDYFHLPLSENLLKTFPKLKSKYFLIVQPDLKIVVHEKQSLVKLRCGSFSNFILAVSILEKNNNYLSRKDLPFYKKSLMDKFLIQINKTLPMYTDIATYAYGPLISLHSLCKIFSTYFGKIKSYSNLLKSIKDISCFLFHSDKNGAGCAFRYVNTNQCSFDCVIFGLEDKNEIISDINEICQWLNRFSLTNTGYQQPSIDIDIFYGKEHHLRLKVPSIDILTTSSHSKVIRTIKHLIRAKAPILPNDKMGYVFYQTDIFSKPIRVQILAGKTIEKNDCFSNILDSIYYIIYGTPYFS